MDDGRFTIVAGHFDLHSVAQIIVIIDLIIELDDPIGIDPVVVCHTLYGFARFGGAIRIFSQCQRIGINQRDAVGILIRNGIIGWAAEPGLTVVTHLDQLQPDIAHIGHLNHLSTGLVDELAIRSIPIVFTLHDFWLMCPRGQFMQRNFGAPGDLYKVCNGQEDHKCATTCYSMFFSGRPEERDHDETYWTNWMSGRQQSAFVAGAFFEKGLVNTLVREIEGQACKLSWIQVELEKLWEGRKGAWLTVEAYENGGGIAESVRETAEKYLAKVPGNTIDASHRMLFMRLIEPGEGVPDRRIKADMGALSSTAVDVWEIWEIVLRMSGPEFRLIESNGGINLCHDFLVNQWEAGRAFLTENRKALRAVHNIAHATADWEAHDKGKEFLFKGALLAELEDLENIKGSGGLSSKELPAREREFLKASFHEQILKKRRRQLVMGVISAALAVAVVFLIFALISRAEARENLAAFKGEEAEKVLIKVEELRERATKLGEGFEAQRDSTLIKAWAELGKYHENDSLQGAIHELDSLMAEYGIEHEDHKDNE